MLQVLVIGDLQANEALFELPIDTYHKIPFDAAIANAQDGCMEDKASYAIISEGGTRVSESSLSFHSKLRWVFK